MNLLSARSLSHLVLATLVVYFGISASTSASAEVTAGDSATLAKQVVIRRTLHGVPHIYADNLHAAGYGLGYAQTEDHGARVAEYLLRARGEWTRSRAVTDERLEAGIDNDAERRLRHRRAMQTWSLLEDDTRAFFTGFAAGVNRYMEQHPDEFSEFGALSFSGQDVFARNIVAPARRSVRLFMEALDAERQAADAAGNAVPAERGVLARLAVLEPEPHPDVGSNAWAFAPERTTSGNAILMRNPHLSWDAGYYEAQIEVPGVLNFYGDFRLAEALGIIGGFNRHLGWATTNNAPDLDEIYALEADPVKPDHYLLDGDSHPLRHETVEVEYRRDNGMASEIREFWRTPFGPVVHRENGKIYVLKSAGDGEYRTGEQFLRMMKARNLGEWTEAMRMRARITSNLTYADAAGNIFYVWNASMPDRPHPASDDATAIAVSRSDEMWQELLPWEALPQLLNPPGGYLRNENDTFHFTNLNAVLEQDDYPDYFPEPRLRLRSQHSVELLHNSRRFSLEDVVAMKHSMRMLLAARVKGDLLRAVEQTEPQGEVANALQLIKDWDNTAARDSRGGLLFKVWWHRYVATAHGDGEEVEPTSESVGFAADADKLFRTPWSVDRPVDTPFGLADFERAADAFEWAVTTTSERYGRWDLPWGEIHRAKIDDVDVALGGCGSLLGCFRVLRFDDQPNDDGKHLVHGGDGWVFAVEFAETPRAYSVLAYGQSSKAGSPLHSDQLPGFANNEMSPVVFSDEDVRRTTVREYRPGL